MSGETRRVVVLGLLACLLGGYAYVTAPEKKVLGSDASKKPDRPVLDFLSDKVTQLAVTFEGKQLVCQRTPQGWVEPTSGTPLRQDAVDDFLANLHKLLHLGEVEGDPRLGEEFGLKPPVAQVSLQIEGENPRTLVLGKNNPVQSSLYAQVNETPQIVLVGSVIIWDMRKLFSAVLPTG